jgi:hypothetical protein
MKPGAAMAIIVGGVPPVTPIMLLLLMMMMFVGLLLFVADGDDIGDIMTVRSAMAVTMPMPFRAALVTVAATGAIGAITVMVA